MSVKIEKSGNFDKNLDSKLSKEQIRKNTFASSEIWKDEANQIAPIDTGSLRQNTTTKNTTKGNKFVSQVTWNAVYAEERYYTNYKNPQTTRWVEKAYDRKKKQIDSVMKRGVIK